MKIEGRNVCSMRQAAQILEVTMGRVRQLVSRKRLWSLNITEFAKVVDRDEVIRLKKQRDHLRSLGKLPGRPSKGFCAN
jgi:hypothetical protein